MCYLQGNIQLLREMYDEGVSAHVFVYAKLRGANGTVLTQDVSSSQHLEVSSTAEKCTMITGRSSATTPWQITVATGAEPEAEAPITASWRPCGGTGQEITGHATVNCTLPPPECKLEPATSCLTAANSATAQTGKVASRSDFKLLVRCETCTEWVDYTTDPRVELSVTDNSLLNPPQQTQGHIRVTGSCGGASNGGTAQLVVCWPIALTEALHCPPLRFALSGLPLPILAFPRPTLPSLAQPSLAGCLPTVPCLTCIA